MYYILNPLKKKIYKEAFTTFSEAFKFQQRFDKKAIIELRETDKNDKTKIIRKILMWDPLWEIKDYGQSGYNEGTPHKKKPQPTPLN